MEKLIAPSLALGKEFELPDDSLSTISKSSIQKQPRVHAFQVGNLGLLLNTEETISEVCNDLSICRLPNTSPWLHGIANQRGNMVPIFNLENILGIDAQENNKAKKYLLFGKREQAVGILIYELPIRLLLNNDDRLNRTPDMPSLLQPYVGDSYQIDQRIWVEWEIFGFFKNICEQIAI